MTLEDAVDLVMRSVFLAHGGEVFVTKMPVVRIVDLANVMVEELALRHGYESVEVKIIGSKAGEKLYEELINEEETRRTVELARYFVVLPAFGPVYEDISYEYPEMEVGTVKLPYNSSITESMKPGDLRDYLMENRLLESEK